MVTSKIRVLFAVASLLLSAPAFAYRVNENELNRVFGTGKNAIARYHFRLEFYALPEGMEICRPGKATELKICSGANLVNVKTLKPAKTIALQHPFSVWPMDLWTPRGNPYLVCSEPIKDRPGSAPKIKGREQFCGIVSAAGDIIYEFPLVQAVPATVAASLGISDDGRRAAIAIGEAKSVNGEDGAYNDVGKLREVWIWEYPDKLKKVPASSFKEKFWRDLMTRFHQGKI